MGGRSNGEDVRLAVTGEVGDDAVGCGDAPVVQHRLLPTLAERVRRLKHGELEPFAAEARRGRRRRGPLRLARIIHESISVRPNLHVQ